MTEEQLTRRFLAGEWLCEHGTKVLIALLDAGANTLATDMLVKAFGMTHEQIRAALEERKAREKAEREP